MAVDAQKITDQFQYFHKLWSAPLQIAIALYLIWLKLGYATLAGMGVMLLMVPLNGLFSRLYIKSQTALMADKDRRTKMMNEILNGIKVLKLYGWEKSFEEQIL